MVEYTANNFGGAMRGDILSAGWSNTVNRTKLSANGTSVVQSNTLFASVGLVPLDITALPDGPLFPGTIWAVDYFASSVIVFEPADFNGGSGGGGTQNDLDGDGYLNSDEIANGTDPQKRGGRTSRLGWRFPLESARSRR